MIYDAAIIGAGVTGASIARRLAAYELSIVLLEKECDVSFGVSKANSGIIHAGFHHDSTSLKAKLEVKGNIMFDNLKKELNFPFHRCGILVAAFDVEEMRIVEQLYNQGVKNGIIGMELCNRHRILSLEPKLNPDVVGGLHAPAGGIIEPYRFVYSLVESAKKNGVEIKVNWKVSQAKQRQKGKEGHYEIISETGERLYARYVINAAGLFADQVSQAFDAEEYTIIPRKGEEFLMDKNAKSFTGKIVFPVPNPQSKGTLVIPTVEGTSMVGPTAVDAEDKEDLTTTRDNFEKVFYAARRLIPGVSEGDIITSFAGLRPTLEGNDFFIDISNKAPRFIQAAGIQSPGLTAAPAIADYVKDLLKKAGLKLIEKVDFIPEVEDVPRIRALSYYEADQLAEHDPAYAEIVCRCEQVSEAEIVAAIKQGHTTLDGIKFYTRAQMGRCQGGFCTYKLLKIIERKTGASIEDITKRGGKSFIVSYKVGDLPLKAVEAETDARETDPRETDARETDTLNQPPQPKAGGRK